MKDGKKIGLALSGGGYRAAAYHLGTLKKLNQMGILDKVDIISTVSGGSITGAYYCLYGNNFTEFENGLTGALKSSVVKGVVFSGRFLLIIFSILIILTVMLSLLFTHYAWLSFILLISTIVILLKFQFKIFPVSSIIENLYDKYFFSKKVLNDLNESPTIAINSTNLETGRPFTFSKNRMNDSKYEYS